MFAMRRFLLCLLTGLLTTVLLAGFLKSVHFGKSGVVDVMSISSPNRQPFGNELPGLPQPSDISITCSNLFFPCLLGNNFGSRQFDGPGFGFVIPLRPPVENPFTKGAFMLRGGIRPLFGEIPPYLLFLRLRN